MNPHYSYDDECPNCKQWDTMTFEPLEHVDSTNAFRDIQCQHCGFKGRAWYVIKFAGFSKQLEDGTWKDL